MIYSKSEIVFYNDLWVFRPERAQWEQIQPSLNASIPCKRYGHSLTVVNDMIYMYAL